MSAIVASDIPLLCSLLESSCSVARRLVLSAHSSGVTCSASLVLTRLRIIIVYRRYSAKSISMSIETMTRRCGQFILQKTQTGLTESRVAMQTPRTDTEQAKIFDNVTVCALLATNGPVDSLHGGVKAGLVGDEADGLLNGRKLGVLGGLYLESVGEVGNGFLVLRGGGVCDLLQQPVVRLAGELAVLRCPVVP